MIHALCQNCRPVALTCIAPLEGNTAEEGNDLAGVQRRPWCADKSQALGRCPGASEGSDRGGGHRGESRAGPGRLKGAQV
jgi:hypothetical protein